MLGVCVFGVGVYLGFGVWWWVWGGGSWFVPRVGVVRFDWGVGSCIGRVFIFRFVAGLVEWAWLPLFSPYDVCSESSVMHIN